MPEYNPWVVRHYNHSDVALGEAFPHALSFGIYLNRVGFITYGLDLNQDLAVRQKTNPYITDWKLFRGDIPIEGGIHTSIDVSDVENNYLDVAGKSWLHYLEGLEYPFDPAQPLLYRYEVAARDIALVVKDILDVALAQSNTLAITYALSAIGQVTNYKIEPADTEKILAKIDSLAKLAPGFDYEITHDRIFKIYSPQKTRTLTTFALEQGSNIEKLRYTDEGPKATHLRGFAQGAAARLGYNYVSPTIAGYRRITQSEEFSDVRDAAALTARTTAEGARQAAPTTEFSCNWINDNEDNSLWEQVQIGDKIHVKGDLKYDMLDSYFRFVGLECQPTDEGDEEIILTFDDGSLSL